MAHHNSGRRELRREIQASWMFYPSLSIIRGLTNGVPFAQSGHANYPDHFSRADRRPLHRRFHG